MQLTMLCLLLVLLGIAVDHQVWAAFDFQRVPPSPEELKALGLTCIPGRTTLKVKTKEVPLEESEEDETRRTHMRQPTGDASCQVCVCSVNGNDEYCSKRPARNVNECIRIASLTAAQTKNAPYDHERDLSKAIRRAQKGLSLPSCIPFVSTYDDCNDEYCKSCSKCRCDANGRWSCYSIRGNCPEDQLLNAHSGDLLSNALQGLHYDFPHNGKPKTIPGLLSGLAPLPPKKAHSATTQATTIGYLIAILR